MRGRRVQEKEHALLWEGVYQIGDERSLSFTPIVNPEADILIFVGTSDLALSLTCILLDFQTATMTSYIPSITLPGQIFATPAASILLPVALGTAVGFSIARRHLLSDGVGPHSQRPSNERPGHLLSSQAAALPSSASGIRSHVDGAVRPDGILGV